MSRLGTIPYTLLGAGEELEVTFNIRKGHIVDLLQRMPEAEITKVDPEALIESIVDDFEYELITLHEDRLSATPGKVGVHSSDHPPGYHFRTPTTVERNIIYYELPGSGDLQLLRYQARQVQLGGHPSVQIDTDSLRFDVVSFDNDPKKVDEEKQRRLNDIYPFVRFANLDLEQFNGELPGFIRGHVQARLKSISEAHSLFDGIDVPVKIRTGAKEEVLAPIIRPKRRIEPLVTRSSSGSVVKVELGHNNYERLIEALSSLGRGFEHLPSSYRDRKETDIRDAILLFLDLIFEPTASSTGEAFNKTGKTDILVKSHGFNVFAAECKFWSGDKGFGETISQLLGYLTHRDTQAAVIIFDKQNQFSKDRDTALAAVKKHSNYLHTLDESDPNQTKHLLFLEEDRSLTITLSVLMFHFPSLD